MATSQKTSPMWPDIPEWKMKTLEELDFVKSKEGLQYLYATNAFFKKAQIVANQRRALREAENDLKLLEAAMVSACKHEWVRGERTYGESRSRYCRICCYEC